MQRLARCRFLTSAELKAVVTPLPATLDRGTAAKVLEYVWTNPDGLETIPLTNHIDFAGESLFCEWAYVIDLDRQTFEVFKGFNQEVLAPTERFARSPTKPAHPGDSGQYHPVKLAREWLLDDLPDEKMFLAALEESEDEE